MSGFHGTGGKASISFNYSNIFWHSSPQANFFDFFNKRIIGLIVSVNRRKILDIVVNLPTKHWISLMFLGLLISMIISHFSRLVSVPLSGSIKPKNLLPSTLKTHFFGFNRRLNLLRATNTSVTFIECCIKFGDFTIISSIYTSTIFPIKWLKLLSINLW